MSEARYDIYFRGDLLDGFYADFVKADMAQLFKTDPARLEAFFAGTPQPVKLKVDKPTAAKYKAALEKIGAKPIIVPMGKAPPAVANPTPQPEANTTDQDTKVAPASAGASDWTILPPGSDIGEHRDIQPMSVDISGLSLAQMGAALVEQQPRPTPVQVDISGLSLDEPGATLVDHPNRPAPVQVDISALSLDEPGAILVDGEPTPVPPAPDISHLTLE
ncbi:hypothetical protein [Saccharospirillum sp.]|uniref:hypothetical protein n=1 Tax=Saccharospirillum sp. TaxID=2033801 RepID=UPI0034A0819A